MFEDAIRYPWRSDDRVETILIGGVLALLGVFLVPGLLVDGYLVRVIRRVSEGDETPPVFEDWTSLLVDGLKAFVITAVYLLVPLLGLAAALAAWILPATFVTGTGGAPPEQTVNVLLLVLALGGTLLALLVVVAAVYLFPAAVAAFAVTGRFGAAFSPGLVWQIGRTGRYAVGWLVAVAVTLLAGLVAGMLSATVLGALLVPFVVFYGNVAAAYAVGRGAAAVDHSAFGADRARADRTAGPRSR